MREDGELSSPPFRHCHPFNKRSPARVDFEVDRAAGDNLAGIIKCAVSAFARTSSKGSHRRYSSDERPEAVGKSRHWINTRIVFFRMSHKTS